ncbi:MAG: membrane protein insertase YidC [Longimicrobiales bacterium]
MDSGRFILAVVLMIAVIVVTGILFPTRPRTPVVTPADSTRVDSAALNAPAAATAPGQTAGRPEAPGMQTPAATPALTVAPATASADVDTVFVTRDSLYRYGFSTRGGSMVVAEVLNHQSFSKGYNGHPVDLARIGGTPLISYRLTVGNEQVDVSSLQFRAVPAEGLIVALEAAQQLRLIHTDSASGFEVELDYTFAPNSYLIDATAVVRNVGDLPTKLLISMGPGIAQTEFDSVDDSRHRKYVLNSTADGIRDVPLSKVAAETIEPGPFNWIALRSKYFVSALLASDVNRMPFGGVIAKPVPAKAGADLTATLLPGKDNTFVFRMFVGPQEPKQLEAIGYGFKDVNPFGWRWARPILRPVGHGVAALLYGIHDLFGVGYGWVLIIFGILIRVLLWPLNAKAMRSQLKNMEMQPRIKEIQAKYKKEPEKMQKAMLALYKEESFNPMVGCLPSLIPFPILITLYFVFANAIAFRGVQFFWLPDLARADPLFILPVLLGVSMFVLQWFSTRGIEGEQAQQMKIMMYIMPPFMTFIFLKFAAGLNLYYATMNVASIPQQMLIMRERERLKAAKGLK